MKALTKTDFNFPGQKSVYHGKVRNTPVIIFINKMDREGRDPFDVLDELKQSSKSRFAR